MGTRKKSAEHIQCLDMNEIEEDCFTEGDVISGKTVATFSSGTSTPKPLPILTKPAYKTTPKGLTPAVGGELYTVKRCYQFRQSTC